MPDTTDPFAGNGSTMITPKSKKEFALKMSILAVTSVAVAVNIAILAKKFNDVPTAVYSNH